MHSNRQQVYTMSNESGEQSRQMRAREYRATMMRWGGGVCTDDSGSSPDPPTSFLHYDSFSYSGSVASDAFSTRSNTNRRAWCSACYRVVIQGDVLHDRMTRAMVDYRRGGCETTFVSALCYTESGRVGAGAHTAGAEGPGAGWTVVAMEEERSRRGRILTW